jgi:hypothetical protein
MKFRKLNTIVFLFGCTAQLTWAACSSIALSAPDSRFVDYQNSTVIDLDTGLTWMRCIIGQDNSADCAGAVTNFTWTQALETARDLNNEGGFAGHSDWRLPNINELNSIVETSCRNPAINENIFPNNASTWSSSPDSDPEAAWFVRFDSGFDFVIPRSSGVAVRLVRGGN